MPCYHPLSAWQRHDGGALIFAPPEWGATNRGGAYNWRQIPCRQCIGCKLTYSRHWAIRCMHEKQMHRFNSYITLTYNDKHAPKDFSLQHHDFQRFMRKVRKKIMNPPAKSACKAGADSYLKNLALLYEYEDCKGAPDAPEKALARPAPIKFYMCGEYGPEQGRPHYHALLFGLDFNDRLYWKTTKAGSKIYRSPTLENLWQKGFSSVGDLTFESAAYIARYVMKKRTGDGEKQHYQVLDLETGEIVKRKKEYNQMSRRPGVGSSWIEKYASDIYTTGKVTARGYRQNPPRYYDKHYKKIDQEHLEHLQFVRLIEAAAHKEHQTPERLLVQEQVQAARTKQLKRDTF